MDTYRDFIPESDPEDHPAPLDLRASAQPKSSTLKQKGKRLRSLKDEDITEEEQDLSMYRLSDDDSDSSLTIYYKAYNKTKPEVNESNAESAQISQDMELEIKRLKAERRKKRKRKKPAPGTIPPNTDKSDDPDEDSNTEMANYQPTRDPSLPRTSADFVATASAYSGHPAWDLLTSRVLPMDKRMGMDTGIKTLPFPTRYHNQLPTTHPLRHSTPSLCQPSAYNSS
jgi:hypothetical protein